MVFFPIQLLYLRILSPNLRHIITTRKPEKTNGITNGNIPSVIITDGHNFVSKFVGIYRRPQSVGDTVGIYPPICRHSLPLFLLLLLSHPTSPLPNCSSPPKLQPHPSQLSTILNTSTQYPYVVTISVSCRFYHFFVSKSILFSFNI